MKLQPKSFQNDKSDIIIHHGEGRTKITLCASVMGNGFIVRIYNENAHIGAVALGEYDQNSNRVSVSIITRLGHKDNEAAQRAAYLISKSTFKPCCVIAGIHLDNITESEINGIMVNVENLARNFGNLNINS